MKKKNTPIPNNRLDTEGQKIGNWEEFDTDGYPVLNFYSGGVCIMTRRDESVNAERNRMSRAYEQNPQFFN